MSKIRILIVDDHPVVREGLKQLLTLDDGMEVVGEASNGLQCLEMVESHCPDLILMDVKMPGISGIEVTRLISQKYPQVKVVVLTIYEEDQYVTEAIEAGAKGYVLKKVNRDELTRIIRHVMEDRAYLDPAITGSVFLHLQTKRNRKEIKPQFTTRELEILNRISMGYTDRQIAESLYVSEHTVRSHIKSLYRKLKVSSKTQAVLKAIREKIVNIDD